MGVMKMAAGIAVEHIGRSTRHGKITGIKYYLVYFIVNNLKIQY